MISPEALDLEGEIEQIRLHPDQLVSGRVVLQLISAARRSGVPEGWVLVPCEPTEEMWRAHSKAFRFTPAEFRAWWAQDSLRGSGPHISGCVEAWRAMVSAAPTPSGGG